MTFVISRKHWVLFAVLLLTQVLGFSMTSIRYHALGGTAGEFPLPGLLVKMIDPFGWITLALWIASPAFLTSLIIVNLFEAVLPRGSGPSNPHEPRI
jgi:hypothetical protein